MIFEPGSAVGPGGVRGFFGFETVAVSILALENRAESGRARVSTSPAQEPNPDGEVASTRRGAAPHRWRRAAGRTLARESSRAGPGHGGPAGRWALGPRRRPEHHLQLFGEWSAKR